MMIHTYEEFHSINESESKIKQEYDNINKYFVEKKVLIDNSGYKGDGKRSVGTSDCDFFFDVSKKQFEAINSNLEKLSNRENLNYEYRNMENKPENEGHKLVRLKFKI